MEKENKKSTKKQLISSRTATRGLINGFISYGFLIGFIFIIIILIIINILNNIEGTNDINILNYTIPAMASIISFFLTRIVCNLSTFDLFKKCKIDKKEIDKVSSKMNLFYLLFILFTLIVIIFNLSVRFKNQKANIEETRNQYYEIYPKELADALIVDMVEEFSINRLHSIAQAVIVEFGLFLGIFSLITTQKKLIEKYN